MTRAPVDAQPPHRGHPGRGSLAGSHRGPATAPPRSAPPRSAAPPSAVPRSAAIDRATGPAAAIRHAAVQAHYAPSVHNTQPWWFRTAPDALEIHADWTRQLTVLDPTGRQLLLSCGCAVFNARVALAAMGWGAVVERHTDSARPTRVATLVATHEVPVEDGLADLDQAVTRRHTNRRRLAADPVAPDVVDRLIAAAEAEGALLREVRTEDDRLALARLTQEADRLENADPAYRAELRRWTHDDDQHRDGVPAFAVPAVDGAAHDDLPIRDFDARGSGVLPPLTASSMWQTLLLLGTRAESAAAWERAGEGLQRVWLELTRAGLVASPITQLTEQVATRQRLEQLLSPPMRTHLLLRVGRAAPTPATRRRRLSDLLGPTA